MNSATDEPTLAEEAAEWVQRLKAQDISDIQLEFREWRARSAEHRREFYLAQVTDAQLRMFDWSKLDAMMNAASGDDATSSLGAATRPDTPAAVEPDEGTPNEPCAIAAGEPYAAAVSGRHAATTGSAFPSSATAPVDLSTAFPLSAFEQYRSPLHRWLRYRLRKPELIEDVAQEVFLRLIETSSNAPLYLVNPLAYIFRIAFRVIAEFEERRKRERVSFDSETAEKSLEMSGEDAVGDLSDSLMIELQIQDALNQLPELYRSIVLLCKRDGLTYNEAARELEISPHTIEKYLIRARQMLCLYLDQHGPISQLGHGRATNKIPRRGKR